MDGKFQKALLDEVIMTIYRPAQQKNISNGKKAVKFLHPGTPYSMIHSVSINKDFTHMCALMRMMMHTSDSTHITQLALITSHQRYAIYRRRDNGVFFKPPVLLSIKSPYFIFIMTT